MAGRNLCRYKIFSVARTAACHGCWDDTLYSPVELCFDDYEWRVSVELTGKLYHSSFAYPVLMQIGRWLLQRHGLYRSSSEGWQNTISCAGITVSLIYVNPRAIGSQVPLLQHLHSAGLPISRLSIGAEVPLITVASEQIETAGLEHITLKPSSTDATSLAIGLQVLGRPGFRSGLVGSAILWVGSGSGF